MALFYHDHDESWLGCSFHPIHDRTDRENLSQYQLCIHVKLHIGEACAGVYIYRIKFTLNSTTSIFIYNYNYNYVYTVL